MSNSCDPKVRLVVVVVLATVVADEVAVVDSVGDAKNSGLVDEVVGNKDNRRQRRRHPTKPLLLLRRCEFKKAASTRWIRFCQPGSSNPNHNDQIIP